MGRRERLLRLTSPREPACHPRKSPPTCSCRSPYPAGSDRRNPSGRHGTQSGQQWRAQNESHLLPAHPRLGAGTPSPVTKFTLTDVNLVRLHEIGYPRNNRQGRRQGIAAEKSVRMTSREGGTSCRPWHSQRRSETISYGAGCTFGLLPVLRGLRPVTQTSKAYRPQGNLPRAQDSRPLPGRPRTAT